MAPLLRDRRILIALAIVAVAYFVAQLALFEMDRAIEWDEAVYASQFSHSVEAFSFAPHRARGIPILIAPVVSWSDSISLLRVYLAAVSAGLVFWAFGIWVRHTGWGAPIAAALLCTSWLGLFYGSEALPNLPAALLAVAALGYLVRGLGEATTRHLVLAGAAFALLVLVRPSDAGWVIFGTALGAIVAGYGSNPRFWGPLVVGSSVGAIPWIVESFARFGSPFNRLRLASEVVNGGWTVNLRGYAELLDGKLVGPDTDGVINSWGLLWIIVLVALLLLPFVWGVDVLASRDSSREAVPRSSAGRMHLLIPTAAATVSIGSYLFFVGVQAPRFLLPGLALVAIPAGYGASLLVRSRFLIGSAALLGLLLVGWHMHTAEALEDVQVARRGAMQELGQIIEGAFEAGPCLIAADRNHIQIAYAAGCRGIGFTTADPTDVDRVMTASRPDEAVWIVTTSEVPADSALLEWPSASFRLEGHYVEWAVHWRCPPSEDCSPRFPADLVIDRSPDA